MIIKKIEKKLAKKIKRLSRLSEFVLNIEPVEREDPIAESLLEMQELCEDIITGINSLFPREVKAIVRKKAVAKKAAVKNVTT